jgi:hypothetical protein
MRPIILVGHQSTTEPGAYVRSLKISFDSNFQDSEEDENDENENIAIFWDLLHDALPCLINMETLTFAYSHYMARSLWDLTEISGQFSGSLTTLFFIPINEEEYDVSQATTIFY